MSRLKPDPTFYPSPKMAMEAPQETYGYVAGLNYGRNGKPDALLVVDLDKRSKKYGQVISQTDLPFVGDELHHFGWNACSSALCPSAAHPHLERRYLIIPGLRSSRVYIYDTQPDPST
jgi:selenium-binding protein 1